MSNLKNAAQKKYGCRWSELHETTREDFEAGWLAAKSDDKAQPVAPSFDDFVDCDECNGNGFRDVKRQVAERKSDVQTFREECESCCGSGKEYKGRPLYAAPQPTTEQQCEFCDGTGEVHRTDGEWLGECTACQKPAEQGAELSDEQMIDLQKAWYGVGADLVGLKLGDFISVFAAARAARGDV